VSEERRHLLLVNPSSGSGRAAKLLPEAESELREHDAAFRTVLTRSLAHGIEEALAAAEAGEVPVVMSGDGLIGAIGGALAGSKTPLGVIPGGRGNDFARAVGIPTEIPEAVANLLGGHEREIDVGEANGERFLCIASTGFDSDCNRLANETKLVRGNLVYAYSALRTLASWKPADFVVTIDGERHEHRGYSVAIANSKAFGGGMLVAPDAELDDGLYDVVLTGEESKLGFVRNLPKVFKGTHVSQDEVIVARAREVRIEADRPFAVYADGDHLADLPATVRLLPRALRVVAPLSAPS
jgi:YegS/Rv2252/BmrU family lipid kinase